MDLNEGAKVWVGCIIMFYFVMMKLIKKVPIRHIYIKEPEIGKKKNKKIKNNKAYKKEKIHKKKEKKKRIEKKSRPWMLTIKRKEKMRGTICLMNK